MRLICLWISFLAMTGTAFAHKNSAHVHGKGKMAIAFDGAKGTVELEAPAESVYGFEHKARRKKDRARVDAAFEKLERRIGEIVQFHASLECAISKRSIETLRKGVHSEVRATFDVLCGRSPRGTTLRVRPADVFPKLKSVDVTVLIDDLQKSTRAGSQGAQIAL